MSEESNDDDALASATATGPLAGDRAAAPWASLERRVAALEADREIRRTLYSYGHAVDYGWEDLYADCFTADATLYWPQPGLMRGLAEIMVAFRRHTHAPAMYHKHFLAEPLMIVDGGRARVQSMFARLDGYEAGPGICAFGRYTDDLVRCPDGRWRFASRQADIESWRHGTPPVLIERFRRSAWSAWPPE
jgi:SnoaL-like domain